jgi:hypothetical protein
MPISKLDKTRQRADSAATEEAVKDVVSKTNARAATCNFRI